MMSLIHFLLKRLEKSINQSDLESCDSLEDKSGEDSDIRIPIWRIDPFNTPYSVAQETARPDRVESEHLYSASAIEIDEKKPEKKDLPHYLEYAYLYVDKSFPIIISSKLSEKEKMLLLQVLEKCKGAIAWKMSDIKGINSSWVSPIHVVPKKGGITIVLNDNNELIPSRIVTGWRMCIDYHKFNDATRKDHFPLPFINQMLESLSGNEDYYFLDGFTGFFQIPIAPKDQEKHVIVHYGSLLTGACHLDMQHQLDKKGAENLAADHLSRLENPDMGEFTEKEIADEFPEEHLMILKAELNDDEPWLCPDNVMRRCVAGNVILEILAHCHSGPTGGHHSTSITGRKVYESGFFWPSIFKDAKDYAMRSDACQRSGNIL
ncbi:reverse transcriptase domain-containing protein [Tanacetum coccineum]